MKNFFSMCDMFQSLFGGVTRVLNSVIGSLGTADRSGVRDRSVGRVLGAGAGSGSGGGDSREISEKMELLQSLSKLMRVAVHARDKETLAAVRSLITDVNNDAISLEEAKIMKDGLIIQSRMFMDNRKTTSEIQRIKKASRGPRKAIAEASKSLGSYAGLNESDEADVNAEYENLLRESEDSGALKAYVIRRRHWRKRRSSRRKTRSRRSRRRSRGRK